VGARARREGALMHVFSEVFRWLGDAAHWSGPDGIPARVLQHVVLSFASVGVAVAIALPAGLFVGHKRRGEFLAVSIANVGRAVPSFAVLVIVFAIMVQYVPSIAFGTGPGLVALALLAIPPILTNAYVGVESVDADTVEAARAMGMRERDVLLRLEVPLAAPVIMGGVRTAAVQVVATASLAALIGGGGLGRYIVDGFARGDDVMTVAGALLIAVLAVLTELVLAGVQRALAPRTGARRTRENFA
jgi:osmoprotectant transport system permease protein